MSSSNPRPRTGQTLLTRFSRGFSPSRWLRAADGLRLLADGNNGQEWVLARSACAFTVLDGQPVPPRKRKAFVDMAVSRWAPFSDPQSHVEWAGDRAMVWAWSRAGVLSQPDGGSLPPPRRILPETLFRGQPEQDGQVLVAMDDGVEGRVWRGGAMAASQWWPQVPSLPDWNEFLRGAGIAPATELPAVPPLALRGAAWAASRPTGIGEAFGHYQGWLGTAAVALASGTLVALLVAALALKVSIWQVDRDIAEREQALEKIITARDAAQQGRDAIEARLALRPPAGQVELLAQAGKLMRGNWQLLSWKMPDAQSLELTARMPNADPSAIVKAFEASRRFSDVTAEVGKQPETVIVRARVMRQGLPGASA